MLPSTAKHSYSYPSFSSVHLSAWWLNTHTHLITFSVSVFTQISISELKWNWAFEWIDWLKVWKNNCQLKLLTKHKTFTHTLISCRFLLNPWELFSHYSVVSEIPSIKSFQLLPSSIRFHTAMWLSFTTNKGSNNMWSNVEWLRNTEKWGEGRMGHNLCFVFVKGTVKFIFTSA